MTQHYEARASQLDVSSCQARISHVDKDSPAAKAGLQAGMVLVAVNGVALRDIIEWRWQADSFTVEVTLEDGRSATLERDFGMDWGIEFDDVLFDGIITCCNACTFCFMRMLPKGMRKTLYLRDDDYRLSFLQGNFVTLTNVSDQELERIIDYDLSPLHVSLHAVGSDVREQLMGRNAGRGMKVLETLLECGIDVHVQVVVVPGVNDGIELMRTLSWINAHPGVLSAGFVPLGYTKYQSCFASSFSDDPDAAAQVIELIREFQEDSGTEERNCKLYISDEFYLDAGYDFPPAYLYDGYPQFQDGIGMMRSFLDDWAQSTSRIKRCAALFTDECSVRIVTGTAFARVLTPLLGASPLAGHAMVFPVENRFFGGNVDVTCLLVGADVLPALQSADGTTVFIMQRESFNDQLALLDDVTLDELLEAVTAKIILCTYSVDGLLEALEQAAAWVL